MFEIDYVVVIDVIGIQIKVGMYYDFDVIVFVIGFEMIGWCWLVDV